jgi:hypothetical protein
LRNVEVARDARRPRIRRASLEVPVLEQSGANGLVQGVVFPLIRKADDSVAYDVRALAAPGGAR